ncbi:MAG TPA: type VI secretion system tip protein TssI/VgrG [Rhizobacter sp.]|nr:type VI secretion system tip protein TssI/VgrG [Rhizobacter sp.]
MPEPITFTSPLPAADLQFETMTASAGLSLLGEIQLTLTSLKADIQPEDLLGKPVTVHVELRDEAKRHFNGYVTRFAIGAHRGRHYGYQATVRPWLWFLTRTSDCRIFQEMSVPDIVKKVFEDHSVANFEFKLFRSYRKWTYCVQYRESDFNFVSRLLEHEGIYWYFKHTDGQHKLVLVDSQSAHDAVPGHDTLPYFENNATVPPDTEYVSNWTFSREVKTGKSVLTSYDFERPSTSLKVDKDKARQYDLSDYEMFDYQGDYIQSSDGQQLAEDRVDELQTRFQSLRGSSNGHNIEVGRLLNLSHHPREDQNAEYLVTALSVNAHVNPHESGGSAGGYECDFSAMPSDQQFRPPRRTPKPFVQGPQSAVVVGPGGEEIFTDKYGRVKVQFHWDRYGKKDDKSSCWVRVSHPWAGKNFGAIHIPRIGQEVVVGFLEGDPDQPIITGRVYNAEQMPPWDLPANATQTGILTRSSKGGGYGNANAIRFEDKAGSEQLWIHAEKNQDIEVEHDETHWVGHDRTKTIDHDETVHVKHDRTETVDNDETITVHHDRKERVDRDETISIGRDRKMTIERDKNETVARNKIVDIGANHTETIGAAMSISVGGSLSESVATNYSETVGIAMEITVGAAMAITVGAAMAETVGGVKSENIGAAKSEVIGGSKSVTVGGDSSETVAKNSTSEIGKDLKETIGGQHVASVTKEYILNAKKIQLVGEDEINFKCGSAEIIMKKNGDITIKGNKINVKGSGDVVIKGSKILEN